MGESKRFTLIERSEMTFESFLGREFGNRFYSDEFLTGISSRRLELHARLARSSGLAFTFATLIAFFDLIAGSAFSYSGLTLQITKDLMPILALFAAGAFLQMTFTFIDEQIVFRILTKTGAKIDVHHFPLLLVDKAAINLWADALAPRYFGPKIRLWPKGIVCVLGVRRFDCDSGTLPVCASDDCGCHIPDIRKSGLPLGGKRNKRVVLPCRDMGAPSRHILWLEVQVSTRRLDRIHE